MTGSELEMISLADSYSMFAYGVGYGMLLAAPVYLLWLTIGYLWRWMRGSS